MYRRCTIQCAKQEAKGGTEREGQRETESNEYRRAYQSATSEAIGRRLAARTTTARPNRSTVRPVHTREPSCPGNLRIVMSACGACSGWTPGMVTDPRPPLESLLMIAALHPKPGTTDAPPLPQSSVFEGGGWCVARSSIPPSVYVCSALSLSTLHRLVHSPSFSFLFALQYVPINQSLGGKAMQCNAMLAMLSMHTCTPIICSSPD